MTVQRESIVTFPRRDARLPR